MRQLKDIISYFRIPDDKPELVAAQVDALSRKVPLMYSFIIINIFGLAFTHYPYAPLFMSVVLPGAFIAISALRLLKYWRVRGRALAAGDARHRLQMTIVLSALLSAIFVAWALALMQYGTSYTRAHVVCFAVVTALGNAVCLMHVRAAVVAMLVGVITPVILVMLAGGHVVFMVMAANIVVVSIAIGLVLLDSSRDFESLIASSVELETQRSAAQELSQAYFQLANVDALTGLLNRRGFFQALDEKLASRAQGEMVAVGVLDLDGFKPVNDIYGHPAGDHVLKEVGKRLSGQGADVVVARLGGDEFGLICRGFTSVDELLMRGDMVCERMRVPFRMDGFTVQMSGCIGMALAGDDALTSEELLKQVDHALYHAKQNGGGQAVLFSDALAQRIRESVGIERRLRDANLEQEMSLSYQFIHDSESGSVIGAEALARWENPMLGPVPPAVFIRAAERCGMIGTLTEVLFSKLLAEFSSWPSHIFVSFNLSAHDICAPDRIARLISIAQRKGVDPARLTFEITETAVMHDFDRARESLRLLKAFGAKIALDDFGTGHSSLSYVHTLPLDRVKVDRSFVSEIENSTVTRAVVQTILDLCDGLDLDCIIEGVETEGQLALMREMGCTTFQGYLFSRPLDGVAARKFIVGSQHTEAQRRAAS